MIWYDTLSAEAKLSTCKTMRQIHGIHSTESKHLRSQAAPARAENQRRLCAHATMWRFSAGMLLCTALHH